jgi:hypothetical protein
MAALLTALAALIVYVLTLSRTVSFWDSGEYITCCWTAGIPHPPGVPLFVLLGRVSAILFFFIPSVAFRVGLVSALSAAACIGILTRLVQRWGGRMGFEPGWYRSMSVLAGLIATSSYSIWGNATVGEADSTALLLVFIIIWAFDNWITGFAMKKSAAGTGGAGSWGEAKYLLLIGYLVILSIGNHGSVPFITGPTLLLLYFLYSPSGRWQGIWRRSWFLMTLLGLIVLAFSVHLYMPIRAVQRPEINETDPSVWSSFEKALARDQYGQTSVFERKGPFHEQIGLFLEYLSWQSGRVQDGWDRVLGDEGGTVAAMVMKVVLIFGALYGLAALWMKNRRIFLMVLLLFLMSSVVFIFFALNFKTGQEGTSLGEVRERDYFFSVAFAFFAMLSGIGLVSAVRDFLPSKSRLAWALLLIPGISLGVNWFQCDRSRSFFARDYGINLLESCPEGAVLITNGDNDTFPLWFAQGVLGIRRDVIVSNLSLMNTNWYVDQLIDRDPLLLDYRDLGMVDSLRPVFVWGPHQFHVTEHGAPGSSPLDGAILRTTFSQSWPWGFTDGRTAVVLPVEGAANQGAISMQDLVLLEMVRRRPIHGREIYFAGTVARDSRVFLEHYQEMEGIAYRITDEPVVDAVNTERGWELMNSYLFTGVDDPDLYKCDQTVQLLRNYVSGYHQLAFTHLTMGSVDSAAIALDEAEKLFVTLPDEWLNILPSRSVIVARLVDGTSGAEAARDTLLAISDILAAGSLATGNSDLAATSSYLASLAIGSDRTLGYQQQMDYDELFDVIDDGSIPFAWLRVELSLMFTDFVSAWALVDGMEESPDDPLSGSLAGLARTTLSDIASESSISTRLGIMDTGLSVVFEFMDTDDPAAFSLADGTGADDIIERMLQLASEGHVMSAVAAGLVLADRMEDQEEAGIVRLYSAELLREGVESRRWAEWYVLERNCFSPAAMAYLAASAGRPAMTYASLIEAGASESALRALLADPEGYVEHIPMPGSGSDPYAWVASLGEGGSS